ncbi:LAMI_0E00958g1_1 [Lachancea mirantina]|uniref:LAMI_0E00958g1_1 n=1 Tax=Lachancea mirantina TaxID=1230905 RepID=A0A1G4JIC7_9SACH|nr:LAMI_0E00958g1_1 [Lachancea mirantina]
MLEIYRKGVFVLTSVALAFQILPVISIPAVESLYLCMYQDRKFGVFGWCSVDGNTCANDSIRYTTTMKEIEYYYKEDFFPSRAKATLSRLLLVHPIALGFTAVLWAMAVVLNCKKFEQSRQLILGMVLWSIPTVLLSLLSYLVDILLFVPYLAWPGWLLLVSIILIVITTCVMCFLRRVNSIQRYDRLHGKDEVEFIPLHQGKSSDLRPTFSEDSTFDDLQSNHLYQKPQVGFTRDDT